MGQSVCCQAGVEEHIEIQVPENKDLKASVVDRVIELNEDQTSGNVPAAHEKITGNEVEEGFVREAVAEVDRHLREFDLDAADSAMMTWLERLNPAAAYQLKQTKTYRTLRQKLGQYEAAKDMILSDGFEVLWHQDATTMHVKRDPQRKIFEYKLVIELDQPLSEAMAHFEEIDLVHKVQTQLSKPARTFGDVTPWQKVVMMCFNVAVFRVEVINEVFRYRGKDGFILEGLRSDFDLEAHGIPEKTWFSTRPWNLTANLWLPHQDDPKKTTFIQVNRATLGVRLPSWVLDTGTYFVARSFAADVQTFAHEMACPKSVWRERISADKDGFYKELRNVEEARSRSKASGNKSMLERSWLIPPELQDTTPSPLRK